MSTKSSDGDEVTRLMQQQGLSRVQATKMLYEIVKQKKKEEAANNTELTASRIAPFLKQEDSSVVKRHIERYSSLKDVTSPVSAVHEDLDLSQTRPTLKIDTENRQASNSVTASSKIQLEFTNNKENSEISDSGAVVAPFGEDKLSESMPAQRDEPIPEFDLSPTGSMMSANTVARRRSSNSALNLRPLARLHPNKFRKDGLSGADSEEEEEERPNEELDYQSGDSSDGEIWEEPTPYPLTAASPVASSSMAMSGVAPAGLCLPPPINTNTSPSQPSKAVVPATNPASPAAATPTSASIMFAKRHPLQEDTSDHDTDLRYCSSNNTSERSDNHHRTMTCTTTTTSSSATVNNTSTLSQSAPTLVAPSRLQPPRPVSPVPPLGLDEKAALLQSCRTPMAPARSVRNDSTELASPTGASVASSGRYTSSTLNSAQTASRAAEIMNVKVGNKKLTVRAAGGCPAVRVPVAPVESDSVLPPPYTGNSPPPAYDTSPAWTKPQASALPPPPPPAYSSPESRPVLPVAAASTLAPKPAQSAASALFEQVSIQDAAVTLSPKSVLKRPSIPMTPPPIPQASSHHSHSAASMASSVSSTESSSVHRDAHRQSITSSSVEGHALSDVDEGDEREDGLTSEERVAQMMSKYRRRSHMKKDALPAAFQNLSPIDEKEIERLMKQDQAEKEAAAMAKSLKTGGSTQTSASASSNSILAQEGEKEVPEKQEVAAVMMKESTDLVEELISQGYSRENALNLAKEIELDRRGERYHPRHITPYSYELGSPQQARGPPRGGTSVSSMRSHDRSFNNDDDAGSVISNISGVSKASSFCESDKLLMNLLLSQQKGKYGTNMYESLTDDDEPAIERYMGQGCTLDQAVLKVFERKYGSVENQMMPKSVYSSGTGKASQIGEDSLEIVDALHAEIELLMLSGGYTRDVAVKMLLSKVAKEKAMQERQSAGILSPSSDHRNGSHVSSSSHHQFHRASSMSAMPLSRELEPPKLPPPAAQHATQSHMMHSARSMYAMPSSGASLDGRSVNSSSTAGRSSRSREMVPPPDVSAVHPTNHHSSHRGITRHHSTSHIHDSSSRRRPHESGISTASASGIASVTSAKTSTSTGSRTTDDREFMSSLLKEQEAVYGVNMFNYLSPDDPEVNRLMSEFGFNKTDAMIAVFQQFPPQAVPPPSRGHSSRGGSGASVNSSSSSGRPLPMHPPAIPRYAAPKPAPAPSTNPSSTTSAYNEQEELERVMRLSMLEVQNRPGVVVVSGTGAPSSRTAAPASGSTGPALRSESYGQQRTASTHDINALVQMGFTVAQAQEALARHNHDLQKAVDYLLGGA